MAHSQHSIAATLLATYALLTPAAARSQGAPYQLVWEDDFSGTTLDPTRWGPQIGTGCPDLCGWGNSELQYYRAENATVSGGRLTITAKEEPFGGRQYTSARLRTKNLGDFERGRFEMRAKLPIGRGLWPAFWLLPTDSVYGVWAASGEIDVMENVGHDPDRVIGTIHYGDSYPGNTSSGGSYTLPSGTFHDDFHVFAIEWDDSEMRWYVDGNLYSTKTFWWSSGGPYPAPFDQRFYILLNLAVGGTLPGSPDASTQFPQTFEVDYVRVYQEPEHDLGDCVCVFDAMEHANPLANGWFTFNGGSAGGGIGANLVDLPPVEGGSASLEAGWGSGGTPGYFGGFGRTNPQDLTGATHFDMWIHPDAGQDYVLEINLQDDDDGDDAVPGNPDGADDEFQYEFAVSPTGPDAISGGGWQRVSIPLASFVDDNSYHYGGNGVFDPTPVSAGANGRLANIVFTLISNSGANVTFRTDRWSFTRRVSSISGRLWNDANGDGLPTGEVGLSGVRVELFDDLGTVVATHLTNGTGEYSFGQLLGGQLEVRVDPATLPPGTTPTHDPDGIVTPGRFALDLACEETRIGQDFGYSPPPGTSYCTPAVPNSTGAPASIHAIGSDAVADQDLTLLATILPTHQFGYFLTSQTQGFVMNPGGSAGNLCLGGTLGRFIQQVRNSGVAGEFSITVDLTAMPVSPPMPVQVGETWNYQCWYRDANPGVTSNFTDAVGVTFH
ncbi:MAG: family 16 glycosylhydrolase [bacterium]|nr:family 16 glycosylhydrolase [bacterium]